MRTQNKKQHREPAFPMLPINPVSTGVQVESTCNNIVSYEKSNVASEIYRYVDRFTKLTGTELIRLKELIDARIEEVYDFKCNFMIHDRLDNYIYVVRFVDGDHHYYVKGNEAYHRFLEDDAISVERKTKDLFPTVELLLKKEIMKA